VIPARIADNRILLSSDPGYIDRLHGWASRSPAPVRMERSKSRW